MSAFHEFFYLSTLYLFTFERKSAFIHKKEQNQTEIKEIKTKVFAKSNYLKGKGTH